MSFFFVIYLILHIYLFFQLFHLNLQLFIYYSIHAILGSQVNKIIAKLPGNVLYPQGVSHGVRSGRKTGRPSPWVRVKMFITIDNSDQLVCSLCVYWITGWSVNGKFIKLNNLFDVIICVQALPFSLPSKFSGDAH